MTGKRRKDVGRSRSARTTTTKATRLKPVDIDGSGDSGGGTASSKPTATASIATGTLLKTKRMPPTAAHGVQPDAIIRVATTAEIDAHDQVLADARRIARSGLAATFARALQRVAKGVTIGIDENLNVGAVWKASEQVAKASQKGHATGKVPVADGLDDPRMRDLDATVFRFMKVTEDGGAGVPARARFAAAVLGVAATDATKVGAVADAALEGLRARLRGEAPRNEALPADLVTLLNEAAKAWRSTSDADFWASMAKVAQPP
jgi:hypothetical protein